jgi:hypothetical protein
MPKSQEWNDLRDHVVTRNFEKAAELLKHTPSLRTDVSGLGETVLHYQAVENDLQGVAWLHLQGFDINTRNQFGTPVVFEVAQLDYRDLLLWFISNGADLRCKDADGQDIKEYVLQFDHKEIAKHLESLGF